MTNPDKPEQKSVSRKGAKSAKETLSQNLCNYSGLLLLPYVDQGNRVAVNHADTVGLVQKRAKSCETADLLSSYESFLLVLNQRQAVL